MQFYWLTAFRPITGDPEFLPDMGLALIWGFHIRLLPRKTNGKTFQKIQKIVFWSHVAILVFFAQIWAKMNFPGKKSLCHFLNIRIIYCCAKNQKKLICHYPEENTELTDGQTDERTDRQP